MIDTDYLERLIDEEVEDYQDTHSEYFKERQEWLQGLRDLKYQNKTGAFEESSDLHVPFSMIMAKAMHARIFQIFSARNIFNVEAVNSGYSDKEEVIKNFMTWAMEKWVNRGAGMSATLDWFISNLVEDGSDTFKIFWETWEDTFVDLDITTEEVENSPSIFGEEGLEDGDPEIEVKTRIKNKKTTKVRSAPGIGTVSNDDFYMPPGHRDVQTAPWVAHRVTLKDDDLKLRVKQKRFDKEMVEMALERRSQELRDEQNVDRNSKKRYARLEGVDDTSGRDRNNKIQTHTVYEWYGRAYVNKDVDDKTFTDLNEMPQEIVVWYHAEIRKILGWTYLHRISPSGRRPFYKADFIPSKERGPGIGIGELLFSLNNHIDSVHNIKLDNVTLASLQFGYYRAGTSFKPDTFRVRPGDLIPVESTDDVKFQNIPYLGNFGENEELALTGYGEKMLAINDINLGNLTGRGVAGALRNATGANFIDRQANIQLNPHLDRIKRIMDPMLSDLFIMMRARMEPELFFRVTGEDGKPIFGNVKKEDLVGDYDFIVDTDLAAAAEQERQQRASLMLQTLLNPTIIQMGILQPGNLYEALKEFLIRHQVRNPDAFITKPEGYAGPPMTPSDRLFKILLGQGETPPIENSVRPEEDHESALKLYEEFRDSDQFGIFTPEQVETFSALIEKHTQFLQLNTNTAGLPNIAGTQFSNEGGLPSLGPQGPGAQIPSAGDSEGGPLGSPEGEVNGPIQ